MTTTRTCTDKQTVRSMPAGPPRTPAGKVDNEQIEAIAARILDSNGNAYHVLGVTRDAIQPQIEEAHRSLRITFHPDKNRHSRATEIFQKVEQAFDTLQVNALRR
eukprot:COSAG02_NODE_40808_length_401_cov_0.850993_1_plen_104_part_01